MVQAAYTESPLNEGSLLFFKEGVVLGKVFTSMFVALLPSFFVSLSLQLRRETCSARCAALPSTLILYHILSYDTPCFSSCSSSSSFLLFCSSCSPSFCTKVCEIFGPITTPFYVVRWAALPVKSNKTVGSGKNNKSNKKNNKNDKNNRKDAKDDRNVDKEKNVMGEETEGKGLVGEGGEMEEGGKEGGDSAFAAEVPTNNSVGMVVDNVDNVDNADNADSNMTVEDKNEGVSEVVSSADPVEAADGPREAPPAADSAAASSSSAVLDASVNADTDRNAELHASRRDVCVSELDASVSAAQLEHFTSLMKRALPGTAGTVRLDVYAIKCKRDGI